MANSNKEVKIKITAEINEALNKLQSLKQEVEDLKKTLTNTKLNLSNMINTSGVNTSLNNISKQANTSFNNISKQAQQAGNNISKALNKNIKINGEVSTSGNNGLNAGSLMNTAGGMMNIKASNEMKKAATSVKDSFQSIGKMDITPITDTKGIIEYVKYVKNAKDYAYELSEKMRDASAGNFKNESIKDTYEISKNILSNIDKMKAGNWFDSNIDTSALDLFRDKLKEVIDKYEEVNNITSKPIEIPTEPINIDSSWGNIANIVNDMQQKINTMAASANQDFRSLRSSLEEYKDALKDVNSMNFEPPTDRADLENKLMENLKDLPANAGSEYGIGLLKALDAIAEKFKGTASTIKSVDLANILKDQFNLDFTQVFDNLENMPLREFLNNIANDTLSFRDTFDNLSGDLGVSAQQIEMAFNSISQPIRGSLDAIISEVEAVSSSFDSEFDQIKNNSNEVAKIILESLSNIGNIDSQTLFKGILDGLLLLRQQGALTEESFNRLKDSLSKGTTSSKFANELVNSLDRAKVNADELSASLNKASNKSGNGAFANLKNNIKDLINKLKEYKITNNTTFDSTTKSVQNAAAKQSSAIKGLLKQFAGLFGIYQIFNFLKSSIKAGNEAIETESLFNTVLAGTGQLQNMTNWVNNLSDAWGINATELKNNSALLFNYFKNMNQSNSAAAEMSQTMNELAYDLASFYNLGVDEAFSKIRSGLSGEIEPLKSLGIALDEATLKQYGYNSSMSQAEKTMIRYKAILAQTTAAQGDMSRTLNLGLISVMI